MNEALQRWRDDFASDADGAFDRLVRGGVPLGAASQLSLGEILDSLFEPGDAALDNSAANWLEKHILGQVPNGMSLPRWVSVLEEYFRGIATMELSKTGEILRRQHKRLRLWLNGFYEGSDRDPEGTYLLALAKAQNDQRFSPLWRRLILREELEGRPYLGIGILGFRKMPGPDGRASSDVPEGLLQALLKLPDKPGTEKAVWKQTMRSLFAAYRRSESYWVEHLAPLLPHHEKPSHARDWLTALLPGIPRWRPSTTESQIFVQRARVRPIPDSVSRDWAQRVRENPALCDTPGFSDFLNHHRAYVQTTGDAEGINKSFNNLATTLVRVESHRVMLALSLIEEARFWAPWDPRNWTSYAIVLCATHREDDAIAVLWEARYRFAWNSVVRNELARILRKQGDLATSESVFRETRGLFPLDIICRTGLADLLIDLGKVQEAEHLFGEALKIDEHNRVARGGLARVLSIRSARTRDKKLRDEAKGILKMLAEEGDTDAIRRLPDFDGQWERATTDHTITFRAKTREQQTRSSSLQRYRAIGEMSFAERLGRAMITLWQAERTEDQPQKSSLCSHASTLLEVPDDQINEYLLAAFVETRGLVQLARGEVRNALTYFEEQIRKYGRRGWIGIRLGEQRARILLGEPTDDADFAESPSSQSGRFALYVARVIQILARTPQESEVRNLLKTLYPHAAELAARVQPDRDGKLSVESGAEMLGSYLQTCWFRPSGIQSTDDLDQPDLLRAVIKRINDTRTDTFDVISNSTLMLAA